MTFRWYGENDCIPLNYIKQIQGMSGVVTAVYDTPVGEVWKEEKLERLKNLANDAGLDMEVIESVPVHEDIKLGKPTRDKYIEAYKQISSTAEKSASGAFVIILCPCSTG